MPDWQKEIRVSDLFKRKSKKNETDDVAVVPFDPNTSAVADAQPPAAHPPDIESNVAPAPQADPMPAQPAADHDPPHQPVGWESPVPPAVSAHADPTSGADSSGSAPPVFQYSEPEAAGRDPSAPFGDAHASSEQHVSPPAVDSTEDDGQGNPFKREFHATDLLKKMGWTGGAPGSASYQRTPRPDAPLPAEPQADSPAKSPDDAGLWTREIRAGDLFRRREPAPSVPGDAFAEEGSEPVSFWKKELSLSDLLRTSTEAPAPVAADGAVEAPTKAPDKPKRRKGPGRLKPDLKRGVIGGKKHRAAGVAATSPMAIPLMRAVNLLPSDFVIEKKRKFGLVEICVAIAAVAVVAGLALAFMSASASVTEAQDQVAVLEQQQAELQQAAAAAVADAGLQVDPLLGEELARASALNDALDSRTVWDRVLRQVTVVMPADTWLRGLGGASTTSDVAVPVNSGTELASTLTLTGYALTREGVAQLLTRMQTIPELSTVQLLAATVTELTGEEVVEFSITATLKEFVATAPTSTSNGVTP